MQKTEKVWFHGTDSVSAETIKKEGLRPNANRFDFNALGFFPMENPKKFDDEDGFVFLSKSKKEAIQFAIFRTDYERAEVGKIFNSGASTDFSFQRLSGDSRPTAQPVLIELRLPSLTPVEEDPHSGTDTAVRIRASIPPQYIKAIYKLNNKGEIITEKK